MSDHELTAKELVGLFQEWQDIPEHPNDEREKEIVALFASVGIAIDVTRDDEPCLVLESHIPDDVQQLVDEYNAIDRQMDNTPANLVPSQSSMRLGERYAAIKAQIRRRGYELKLNYDNDTDEYGRYEAVKKKA